MSGPNLNLDYDPLEGPSTRIWKPKEQVDERKLEHMRFFMNKIMDNVLSWKTGAAASSDANEPTPKAGSERDEIKNEPAKAPTDEKGQENVASKIDLEKLEVFRNLAQELGSQMGPEQKVACGILFNNAIKGNLFSSSKLDEEQLEKLQSLVRELSANMPVSQRFAFGAMCHMAIERFREQAMRRQEEAEQLPVEKEKEEKKEEVFVGKKKNEKKEQLPIEKAESDYELD